MATQSVVLTTKTFDTSRLVLGDPEPNKERKNVFSAKLMYKDESDNETYFYLQTPKLYTPFGASSYNDDDKYALTFILGDQGSELDFKNLLKDIESRVAELVKGLKGKMKKNDFTKLVRDSRDPEKYKPTFSVKLKANQETGELFADVFNNEREERKVNLENITKELPRKSKVVSLLMMNKVWFVNKNCGITVNAKQLMVFGNKDQGCMITEDIEDSDEENNEEENNEEDDE